MNKLYTFALVCLGLSTHAFAGEQNLFTCSFDGGEKSVTLTMISGDDLPQIRYIFGQTGGKAELEVTTDFQPLTEKDGYRIWYDEGQTGITIYLGEYTYAVEPSITGSDEGAGYLSVTKSDKNLYSNTCDEGSLTFLFEPLWDELDAKGWFYIYDSQVTGWVNKGNIK